MGRCLTCGIATSILVYIKGKKNSNDLEEIKSHLSKYFSLDYYNIIEYNNCYKFEVKKVFFESNIHECLKEMNNLTKITLRDNDDNKLSEEMIFNKDYPLKLERYDKNKMDDLNTLDGEYYLKYPDGYEKSIMFMDEPYWIYFKNKAFNNNYEVRIIGIYPWIDIWSNLSEEDYLLYILNSMKMNYYNNSLAKNVVFDIFD